MTKYLKKIKKITKDNSQPDDAPEKPNVSSNLQVNAEIVNGTCPHDCKHNTVLSIFMDQLYL
jgi:hypothetical protein